MSRWDRLLIFGACNLAALACFVICFALFPVISLGRPRKLVVLYVPILSAISVMRPILCPAQVFAPVPVTESLREAFCRWLSAKFATRELGEDMLCRAVSASIFFHPREV